VGEHGNSQMVDPMVGPVLPRPRIQTGIL